jgi:sugar lactone lactonase YvrE
VALVQLHCYGLVNQQAADTGLPPVGCLNPAIYAIGLGTNYSSCFHDITNGNNFTSKFPSNYSACPGYDLCTGWGTPVGPGLITNLLAAAAATPPWLITGVPSLTVTNGAQVSWDIVVSGSGPFAYQWEKNGTNLTDGGNVAGSKTTNLVLSTVTTNDSGTYTVVITNGYGATASASGTLTVVLTPFILAQPQSLTVTNGLPASFSVSVYAVGPFTCQWQKNGTNLSDGGNIAGSTTTNLVLSTTGASDPGAYAVILTNLAGAVTSAVAQLTVLTPPYIIQQPADQIVLLGGNVTFNVAVSGTGPFTYQWQFNGVNLTGGLPEITTVAGNGTSTYLGDGRAATSTGLNAPEGVAVDSQGNLYIADTGNQCIRKVNTNGLIFTVAGNGTKGFSGNGSAATNAKLNTPYSVLVDGCGNLFISDTYNSRVRKVGTNGVINTCVGGGTIYPDNGGAATNAKLASPEGLGLGASNSVVFPDNGQGRIYEVLTNGIISIVAGNGLAYPGDGGTATNALLISPSGVAIDSIANLFIADSGHQRIRVVGTNGIINTVAGGGTNAPGDGGAATSALLNNPTAVAVDAFENLFIADSGHQRIRIVGTNGIINTVAGCGVQGYAGDGAAPTNAELNNPNDVVVDASGNLVIADTANNRIRKVAPGTIGPPTLTLTNISAANAGSYTVIITDPYGSVTSAAATLTLLASPPNLSISQLSNNQADVSLSFPTLSGPSYTIQVNTDLNSPNWTDCTNFTGTGSIFQLILPVLGNQTQFFRIRSP